MHLRQTTSVRALARCFLVFVAASSLSAGTAIAQEEQPAGNTGPVSVGAGMDIGTSYYFRGIVQETEGFIAQPYLEAGIALFENDNGQSVSVTAGLWNSLHSGPTGSDGPGDPAMWYESDFYASLGLGLGEGWSADVTYTGYTSPNGTFGTVKELAFGVSYEDEAGLAPYVTLARELDGQADGGLNEGTYLELGVGPGVDIPDSVVSLSFPIAVGLSVSDYYETASSSDTFGFFQFGAILSVPLPLPAEFGEWAVSGGVNFLTFGDALQTINGSDQFEPIGVFGISLGY